MIYINLESPLILPVNYNHILQAVIYQGIGKASDFGNFMHEEGYYLGQRQYKMFQFSQLSGKYSIKNNQIVFRNQVSFEVRSLDPVFLRLLGESFWRYGITFGSQKYGDMFINEENKKQVLDKIEKVFNSLQDRQKSLISDILTIKLWLDLDETDEKYSFINKDVIKEWKKSGVLPTQREIAGKYERNEASVSRTVKDFQKKLKKEL